MEQINSLNNFIVEEYEKLCSEYQINMFKNSFKTLFETKNIETESFDIESARRLVTTNFKNLGIMFFHSTMASGYGFYPIKEKTIFMQYSNSFEDLK